MWILENPDTSQVFFKCLWSGYERGKETPSGHHTVQDETHGQEGQLRMMHVQKDWDRQKQSKALRVNWADYKHIKYSAIPF